jgi:hypothetical protein
MAQDKLPCPTLPYRAGLYELELGNDAVLVMFD